jgi:hypothetical protein
MTGADYNLPYIDLVIESYIAHTVDYIGHSVADDIDKIELAADTVHIAHIVDNYHLYKTISTIYHSIILSCIRSLLLIVWLIVWLLICILSILIILLTK